MNAVTAHIDTMKFCPWDYRYRKSSTNDDRDFWCPKCVFFVHLHFREIGAGPFFLLKSKQTILCPTSLWDKHLAITSANLNSAIIAARAVAVAVVASPRHSIHSESLISVIQVVKKKAERKKKKFWRRVPNCFLLFIPDANSVIDPASRLCGWRLAAHKNIILNF